MARTFSLGRLMIGITLICVVCAFAANFPRAAVFIAYLFVMLAPAFASWLAVERFARNRRGMVFVCLIGEFFGLLLACVAAALVLLDVGINDAWRYPLAFLVPLPGPSIGVLFAGGTFLLCEKYFKWYESSSSQ